MVGRALTRRVRREPGSSREVSALGVALVEDVRLGAELGESHRCRQPIVQR